MRLIRQAVLVFLAAAALRAQVTTATLYGVVRDATGAVMPGAKVTATNQGTGIARDAVSDERGEFALPALPTGQYTIRIERQGFKASTSQGLELGAGQTVRQTFELEVGQLAENVTVAETAPLVETASAAQQESLGRLEVSELPVSRRNLVNLVTLAPGTSEASVGIAGGGNIRLNGVAEGGNAITVDGTDAIANPETRGMSQYGGQGQISIMSIEAIAEVQVIKGILPAEYGAVVGGQVNMLTRSGTNAFHGAAFESFQNDKLNARDAFLTSTPPDRFNQFGGALGGPIIRKRAFFFTTYEGYRESAGLALDSTVPTQQLKDRILAALPMPETKIVLDTLPQPTEPVNADIGRFRAAKSRTREENHFLAKGDVSVLDGNLSVTYSRMRPLTVNPSIYVGNSNDQRFENSQDRIAAQYVRAHASWISETRFGWNRSSLDRVQNFWFATDPANTTQPELTTVGRRLPLFTVSGLFSTPGTEVLDLRGRTFSVEQKFGRVIGTHNLKAGLRWGRQAGSKTNPQNPIITYQTVADLLANVPTSLNLQNGQPPHDGHLDEFGLFAQDDWRVNKKLVLNMGLRYDSYGTVHIHATTSRAAEIYNLGPPTDIAKMDFGAPRDPQNPYDADRLNFGPRFGFAWTVDQKGKTVVRGGSGVLFSPQLFAMFQNTVTDPFIPATIQYNRTDLAARGIKWPAYGEDIQKLALKEGNGSKRVFSLIDTHLRNPYTVQTMIDVERALAGAWMLEVGYFRTDGSNFPLHRPMAQAFDRATGARPNPALGTLSGYYITSEQTMVYDALQTSLRKRLSSGLALDFHYTFSKGWAEQGGALASNFVNGDIFVTQDYFNPFLDRAPLSQEARHRYAANAIYQLPWLSKGRGALSQAFGGWQVASVITARTGVPLRVTQSSGIANSRPDLVAGGKPVLSNYRDTLLYLNKGAFAPLPTYAATGATVRAGNVNPAQVRGPANWNLNLSAGKTFVFMEQIRLEIRGEALNAFNHVNFNNPGANITAPTFGVITGDAGPRIMQLAARIAF